MNTKEAENREFKPGHFLTKTMNARVKSKREILKIDNEKSTDIGARNKRSLPQSNSGALPLDWTRIKRRPRTDVGRQGDKERVPSTLPLSPKDQDHTSISNKDGDCQCCIIPNNDWEDKRPSNAGNTVEGMAIFCLHDTNVTWFQGHFLPTMGGSIGGGLTLPKSFGLLAKECIIDECLQCANGGYRELNVTLSGTLHAGANHADGTPSSSENSTASIRVVSTGGEMMRFRTKKRKYNSTRKENEKLSGLEFDTVRVVTGNKASNYINKYFNGLLRQRQKEIANSDKMSPENLLPDCAIVIGKMRLTGTLFSPSKTVSEDNDDGWLSE